MDRRKKLLENTKKEFLNIWKLVTILVFLLGLVVSGFILSGSIFISTLKLLKIENVF